jgi:hypothetical protein
MTYSIGGNAGEDVSAGLKIRNINDLLNGINPMRVKFKIPIKETSNLGISWLPIQFTVLSGCSCKVYGIIRYVRPA